MKLTAANVQAVLFDCFLTDEEITGFGAALKDPKTFPECVVAVYGVINNFGLHKDRLEKHKDEIKSMLLQLPTNFRETVGGGWSMLNACVTSEGSLWGEHRNIEQLFVLGIATGLGEFNLPREAWVAMPGGLPYYMIKDKGWEEQYVYTREPD